MDDAVIKALCLIHENLPRKGPGSDRVALSLIERIKPLLPNRPRAADLGCGNGHSSLLLAERLEADVLAVDFCQAFLDELAESLETRPAAGKVTPRLADMLSPGLEPGSCDLIWSEGAAFAVGTMQAFEEWRPLLAPGGLLVLSECCWFTGSPPPEAKAFWEENYREMGSVGDCIKAAESAGYTFLHAETLPSADWWTTYFDPLAVRLRDLEKEVEPESLLAEVIRRAWVEQDNFRRFSDNFGYLFLVLKG